MTNRYSIQRYSISLLLCQSRQRTYYKKIQTRRAGLSERGALARFGCHGKRGAQAYKGVWGGARSAGPGDTAPSGRSGGFAELALGMEQGGPLFDKSELQNDRAA